MLQPATTRQWPTSAHSFSPNQLNFHHGHVFSPHYPPHNPSISHSSTCLLRHTRIPTVRPSARPSPFRPMADPRFVWGELDSTAFCRSIKVTYDEVIHWRRNCFQVSLGDAGKSFVAELARLYDAFSSGSTLAQMATSILPILLLQQPHARSKTKDHIRCLERRLRAWKDGDLAALVKEGRSIQQRLAFKTLRTKTAWPDASLT